MLQTCNSTSIIWQIPRKTQVLQRLIPCAHGKIDNFNCDVFRGGDIKNQIGRSDVISFRWLLPPPWHTFAGIGWLTEHLHLPAVLCDNTNEKWVITLLILCNQHWIYQTFLEVDFISKFCWFYFTDITGGHDNLRILLPITVISTIL